MARTLCFVRMMCWVGHGVMNLYPSYPTPPPGTILPHTIHNGMGFNSIQSLDSVHFSTLRTVRVFTGSGLITGSDRIGPEIGYLAHF